MPNTLTLDDLLTTPVYPFTAAIALGAGRSLEITYRPSPASAKDAVKSYLMDAFAGLGFDPKVALRVTLGRIPTGEDAARMQEAVNALEDDDAVQAVLDHADGLAVSFLVGSWNLDQPVTPETCAKLPGEIRAAIVRLASGAEMPTERLAFLAASPRS